MLSKGHILVCMSICIMGSLYASRCVRLKVEIEGNRSYTVNLESNGGQFFTSLRSTTQVDMPKITGKLFTNNFNSFTYNSALATSADTDSYKVAIDALSVAQAEAIIKRQSYTTQAQHYLMKSLIGMTTVQKARSILENALNNFGKVTRAQCVDFYTCDQKKTVIDVSLDLDNDKLLLTPYSRVIYNAIGSLGKVLGFEIPPLAQAWYMRHKGKIAIGVGTGLAFLAIAKYTNLLGNKNQPTAMQPQAKLPPTRMETGEASKQAWYSKYKGVSTEKSTQSIMQSTIEPAGVTAAPSNISWYSDPVGAAKAQVNAFIGAIGTEGSKQVSKAMVAKLAERHSVGQPVPSSGVKDVALDLAAREVIKILAEAYDMKVVTNVGSEVAVLPASAAITSPSFMGNVRSWFEGSLSSTVDAVRSGVTKAILSPKGGGVAKSYKDW